ncbi:hypothetical protein ACO1NA_13945, partial [Staphylococcus aureus]
MDNSIQNSRISELLGGQPTTQTKQTTQTGAADFQAVLQDRLKLSGHAQTRLQSRQIDLNQDQWNRVVDGVDRAAAK